MSAAAPEEEVVAGGWFSVILRMGGGLFVVVSDGTRIQELCADGAYRAYRYDGFFVLEKGDPEEVKTFKFNRMYSWMSHHC